MFVGLDEPEFYVGFAYISGSQFYREHVKILANGFCFHDREFGKTSEILKYFKENYMKSDYVKVKNK